MAQLDPPSVPTSTTPKQKPFMSRSSRWESLEPKRDRSARKTSNSSKSSTRTKPLPVFASLSSGHGVADIASSNRSQEIFYEAVRSLRKLHRNHTSITCNANCVSRQEFDVLREACQRVSIQLKGTCSLQAKSNNKSKQSYDGLLTEAFILLLHSLVALIPNDKIDVDAVLRDLVSALDGSDNDWLRLTEGQLSSSISMFRDCYQKLDEGACGAFETKYLLLQCTSNFIQIKRFAESLQGEETSNFIVRSIFLPILEQQTWTEFSQRNKFWMLLLKALFTLIRQHHHASALLAPLVVDVSENGEEELRPNPLRLRLLSALLDILLDEHTTPEASGVCCNILATVLDVISYISGQSGRKIKSKDDTLQYVDVPAVARKINLLLQVSEGVANENIESALKLLSAISRGFPQAICGYWYLFFPESTRGVALSTVSRGPPPLLILMKSNMPSVIRRNAILTSKDLLKSLPLHLWLGISIATQRIRYSSSRTLSDRVRSAMTILIDNVIREIRERGPDVEIIAAFCSLSISIVTNVPINSTDGAILSSATKLVQLFGDLYTEKIYTADSYPFADFILASLGGIETQAGSITPLPLPTEMWLEQRRSLLPLLAGTFNDSSIKTKVRLQNGKILAQILRMAPWLAEDNFVTEVAESGLASKESKIRHCAVSIILHMLHGRKVLTKLKRFEQKDWTFIYDLLYKQVYSALSDLTIVVKIDAIKSFSFLLGSDWDELDRISNERSNGINNSFLFVEALLDLAEKGYGDSAKKSDDVRAASCKTLAHIVTSILRHKEGQKSSINTAYMCQHIADTMITVLSANVQASVKCMAELAVGNLAHAINLQNGYKPLVSLKSYTVMCKASYAAMNDENEKLAAGAIRSIGHLLNGFFHLLARNKTWLSAESDMIELVGLTTAHLAQKINLCIDCHSSPEAKSKLTWKQRMNMNKQAWGSCHSLGHMLTIDMLSSHLYVHFIPILDAMIRCINEFDKLNQKVVAASASTLNTISNSAWCDYLKDTHILSDCINATVRYLFKNDKAFDATPVKVVKTLNYLLTQLLVVAKCIDVMPFTEEMLDFLYIWMSTRSNILITNEVNAFELARAALTRSDPNNDRFGVSIMQKFSSRASLERRKRELTGDKNVDFCTGRESNATKSNSMIDEDEL